MQDKSSYALSFLRGGDSGAAAGIISLLIPSMCRKPRYQFSSAITPLVSSSLIT